MKNEDYNDKTAIHKPHTEGYDGREASCYALAVSPHMPHGRGGEHGVSF